MIMCHRKTQRVHNLPKPQGTLLRVAPASLGLVVVVLCRTRLVIKEGIRELATLIATGPLLGDDRLGAVEETW